MPTPITEMFTQLPVAVNSNMSDIIAAVQGYSSPAVLGSLNQTTLQQVFNLMLANTVLNNAGNPNGVLAGITYQFCWDVTNLELYVCSTSGTASTAIWTLVADELPLGMAWNTVDTPTRTMVSNNGYIINNGAVSVAMALPLASSVGDEIIIMGFSAGGYSITQGAGQQIIVSPDTTTFGVGGSLASTNQYNAISLRCMVANSIWGVPASPQGVFTIV